MDVITHKCPNCGGALTFDPGDQKFHCPFCLSIFTEDEVTAFEEKQKEAQMADTPVSDPSAATETEPSLQEEVRDQADAQAGQMDLFTCPSCGAEIVTDATTAATYCYFCHNPVVLSGRLSGEFLPSKVLPFAIEKEEATKKFLEWAQKKKFVPRDFFDQAQVEKLTGVYFPYWVVDAEMNGSLSGMGTSLRIWRVGDIEYTEHKQYDVLRRGKIKVNELLKHALSKNVQQKMVTGVQPFPLEKAVAFRSQYLAGFQAEKRDIEYIDLSDEVKNELSGYAENLLAGTVNGYTSFKRNNRSINLTKEENNYVLLPVWLVTYRADDENKSAFYYAMNGQTGKVSGVLPISYKRLGIVSGAIFAATTILALIGAYFL